MSNQIPLRARSPKSMGQNLPAFVQNERRFRGFHYDLWIASIPQSIKLHKKILASKITPRPRWDDDHRWNAIDYLNLGKRTVFRITYTCPARGENTTGLYSGPDASIIKAILRRKGINVQVEPAYIPDFNELVRTIYYIQRGA